MKDFFKIFANKHDDPAFKPCSNCYPDLHDHFIFSFPLLDDEIFTLPLVTPNEIKVQLETSRCKVNMKNL